MQGAGFKFVLGVTDYGQMLSEIESHMTAFPAFLVHSTLEASFLRKGLNPADEFIASHVLQYRTLMSDLQVQWCSFLSRASIRRNTPIRRKSGQDRI
jgi:hypothetical protein